MQEVQALEFRKITDDITVSPQITADHLQEIADAGYRAVICNRPDGEGADQPTFDEIAAAAKAKGLEARYQPVTSGKVMDEDAEAFGQLLREGKIRKTSGGRFTAAETISYKPAANG